MAASSTPQTHLISSDPRVHYEIINELHSYIESSERGYLTPTELCHYYRQQHNNAEIPYRLLGHPSLFDLLSSDKRFFAIDIYPESVHVYSAIKVIYLK
jgi:hypothetical protein